MRQRPISSAPPHGSSATRGIGSRIICHIRDHIMELLELLKTSHVVTIGTTASNGDVVETPVGVVVVADAGYIRSQNGSKANWYQRALQPPAGFAGDGNVRLPVIFEHETEAETIHRADRATYRKYGG